MHLTYTPNGPGVGGLVGTSGARQEVNVVLYDHDKGLMGGSKEFLGAVSLDLRLMPVRAPRRPRSLAARAQRGADALA